MVLDRWIFTLLACLLAGRVLAADRPLMEYVGKADPAYAWTVSDDRDAARVDGVVDLSLTSQKWQGIVWKHHLTAIRPKEMKENPTALLFVTGDHRADSEEAVAFRVIANLVRQPIFIVWDVPNQPLFDGLGEDALISHTFVRYMETGDATWPALFPMVKAAVRAMDAGTEYARKEWKTRLAGFVVSGASKRGWTTWLTGVADRRVKAIAPMVFDTLNLPAQMKHQIDTWGRYSEQIADYSSKGLPDLLQSEKGKALGSMVDPYTYRKEVVIPKLIINGTNDPYWPLDASSIYFNDLAGPKNLLYAPNSGHGLNDRMRVMSTLAAFWSLSSEGKRLPEPKWSFAPLGEGKAGLRLTIDPGPDAKAVRVWRSESPTRDFRPAKWASAAMEKKEDRYEAELVRPEKGCAAFFGEVEYAGQPASFNVSTLIRIVGEGL